jgi:hypothetical protein
VETASAFLADDVAWISLGATPQVFADRSAPYAVEFVSVVCDGDARPSTCDATWTDLWVDAVPDIETASIRITGETHHGVVVAFREWHFATEVIRAFDDHNRWLSQTRSADLAQACGKDPGAPKCSTLLVETVEA